MIMLLSTHKLKPLAIAENVILELSKMLNNALHKSTKKWMIKNIVSDLLNIFGDSIKDYFRTTDFLVGSKVIADNCRTHLEHKISV